LHAGGNLYPDITEKECKTLMTQSIDMARLFPNSIDERPTFISVPKSEKYSTDKIKNRLDMLVAHYDTLIAENPFNNILGDSKDYYKAYTKADLIALAEQPAFKVPTSFDQWMANAIKLIDIESLKMPVFLVQEYGWNLFRLGAQAQLALNKTDDCELKLNTTVTHIIDVRSQNLDYNWEIHTNAQVYKVNYLVNSCGFKTGDLDQSLNLNAKRLIEFKAAYVSKWQPIAGLIPELIFHGERGTPNGMVQLTPYCQDYYQIHGMTTDITLFKNGLVQSKDKGSQPTFNDKINQKLYHNWPEADINTRTENAIKSVTKFVPNFETAIVGAPPLYGAQQIHGNDPNLRVGEVSFPGPFYARSEIIKASSALTVANQIIAKLQNEDVISVITEPINNNLVLESIDITQIDELAAELAAQRGYPKALSKLLIER
jgi:hypothetical protein